MLSGTGITSDRSWSNRFLKAWRIQPPQATYFSASWKSFFFPLEKKKRFPLAKVFLMSNLILPSCNARPLLLAL